MHAPAYRIAIDGHCGFCKRSADWLHAIDWRNAIAFDAMDEPGMVEMRVTRLRDQRTLGGFDGFRMVAPAVPLLLPLWPFLWIPGVSVIGRMIYRWVARHRGELPGAGGACALPDPNRHGTGHGTGHEVP